MLENYATRRDITALWLEEASSGRPLSDLELIHLSKKAARFTGDGWRESIPDLSRVFGRKISTEFLQRRLWKLLDHDEETLESLHRGRVSTGDLLLLSEQATVDAALAVRLLSAEEFNRREQKEAVYLMLRLADSGAHSWRRFADAYRPDRQPLLEALRAACNPSLADDLGRIEEIVRDMHLPPGAAIRPPENLEGGSYRLTVPIRDEADFSTTLRKLRDALREGTIGRLLKILRGEG
jgi:hypothetical protein